MSQSLLFSCEFCKISNNTYFEEHLQMIVSGKNLYFILERTHIRSAKKDVTHNHDIENE